MLITTQFLNAGVPAIGLAPTIRIRDVLTGALIITDAAMTEIGDGMYKYDFVGYVGGTDYAIRADGGVTLTGSDRYVFGVNNAVQDNIPTNPLLTNDARLNNLDAPISTAGGGGITDSGVLIGYTGSNDIPINKGTPVFINNPLTTDSYAVNWSALGAAITNSTFTVTNGTVNAQSNTANIATANITGTQGGIATVTHTVTIAGNTYSRTFNIIG